jgi:very-short-patch-repair endonuclease
MSRDLNPRKRKVPRAIRSASNIEMLQRLLAQEPGPWTPTLVLQGFSYLYHMNWKEKDVPEMLGALAQKVASCQGPLGAETVSSVLNSLRNMSTRCRETREVLAALIPKFDKCKHVTGIQIRISLYGLKSMSSDVREVKDVLAALTPKIEGSREELDAQAVSSALYGLKSMNSDALETRGVLAALAPKIEACRQELSAQAVGNALYGFQNMSSDVREVENVLAALVPKIEACREELDAQAVGSALYGLQNMSSDVREVVDVLAAMTPKIEGCNKDLLAQDIGNALYGMQGMDDRMEQVHALLGALERQIEFFHGVFPPLDAAQAIQGLLDRASPPASHIRELVGAKIVVQSESASEEMILHLASVMLIGGMALPASVSGAYSDALAKEYARVEGRMARCKSKFEADMVLRLATLYPSLSFQANTRIVDGLEMDIYFPDLKLNIELDGPSHLVKTTRSFNSKRDVHLQKKGIQVHRIDIRRRTTSSAMNDVVGVLSSFGVKTNIGGV